MIATRQNVVGDILGAYALQQHLRVDRVHDVVDGTMKNPDRQRDLVKVLTDEFPEHAQGVQSGQRHLRIAGFDPSWFGDVATDPRHGTHERVNKRNQVVHCRAGIEQGRVARDEAREFVVAFLG